MEFVLYLHVRCREHPGKMDIITTPDDAEGICDLSPSRLGTREYWESLYVQELENFKENPEDSGEVWFGKSVETRLIKFITESFPKDTKILDLGCGNGHFLHRLHQKEFSQLHGIDYSHAAVELAKELCPQASFSQMDIFNCEGFETFDLIHDKGTFDAISLRGDQDAFALAKAYSHFVLGCFHLQSFFLITSCNWTQSELVKLFSPFFDQDSNVVIEHSSFSFGGSKGQTVSSVLFKPKKSK